ncbi:MAG: hypothetical protein ACRDKB_10325 [Actinomycetota bacterium]
MDKTGPGAFILIVSLLLGACGSPPEESAQEDLLFLQTGSGVAIVETGATSPTFRDGAVVPSRDWSTVVRTVTVRNETRLEALNPTSGVESWSMNLAGNLRVKVVSEDGDLVALGPARESHYSQGRASTKLVIAGKGIPDPRTIKLEGSFEPEAFSIDGRSLFVIEYLPARAPSSYRVRRLDLESGRAGGVYTVDEELQQAMGGTARIQATSPDGRRLYTLYTLDGSKGASYAFIHVLSLDELWAHCIDLPPEFANSSESATALTVSPDGKRLYVANTEAGAVAEVDTDELKVVRTGDIGSLFAGRTHAVIDSDRTLYIASGTRVVAMAIPDLTQRDWWSMPEEITGVQLASDESKLYVGLRKRIVTLDVSTGEQLGVLDPPGVNRIDGLGRTTRSLDEERTEFVCAC